MQADQPFFLQPGTAYRFAADFRPAVAVRAAAWTGPPSGGSPTPFPLTTFTTVLTHEGLQRHVLGGPARHQWFGLLPELSVDRG